MTRRIGIGVGLLAMAFVTGCASTPDTSPGPGGITYQKDPDLGKVWLAQGFDFKGYDTLYIAEPRAEVPNLNPDGVESLEWARGIVRNEFKSAIEARNLFRAVVTRETDIRPGSRTLRLETTIIEYEKGGGATRYFAGVYGAGQPLVKVRARISEGDRPLFMFEDRRRGDSPGARILGGFRSNRDIQEEDIRDLSRDFASFIVRIAKGEKKS